MFVGSEGAGKTTFCSMLSGNLRPSSGKIKIFGQEMNSSTVAECQKKILFCSQFCPYFRSMTVQEQIRFFLRLERTNGSMVDSVLSKLGLSGVVLKAMFEKNFQS